MAGYSKTPLPQKLGLKPAMRIALLRMPTSVVKELTPLPQGTIQLQAAEKDTDFIHFFAENIVDLQSHLPQLKSALKKSGILWISWRKAKNNTDLTENDIRALALKHGLVDIKVCAIDDTWSALKLVYRLQDR